MTGWRPDADARPLTALISLPPAYLLGLRQGLDAVGLETVALATADDLVSLLEQGRPVVAVLAAERRYSLPDGCLGRLGLVLLVRQRSAALYADTLRQGAAGVIDLDGSVEEIVQVVVAAARGYTLLPTPIATRLAAEVSAWAEPGVPLTAREVEWLRSLADSTTVGKLARLSGYSEREMYRLLSDVYARLGAATRTEALLIAQRRGLLGLVSRDWDAESPGGRDSGGETP